MTAINPLILAALQANPQSPLLQPGTVMSGLVLGLIDDLTLRLQLPIGTLDVASDVPLPVGTRVQFALTGTPAEPKIVLTPLAPRASTVLPNGTAQPAAASPFDDSRLDPAAMKALVQNVVTQIVQDAVGKQGGLAPLIANLNAAVSRNSAVPASVRDAAQQVLSFQLDVTKPVSGADIKTVLAQSGLLNTAATDDAQATSMRMPASPPAPLPGQNASQAAPVAADLRGALIVLRDSLKTWIGTLPTNAAVPAADALSAEDAMAIGMRASNSVQSAAALGAVVLNAAGEKGDILAALKALPQSPQPQTPPMQNTQPLMRGASPPPPYQHGATVAQAPALPTLAGELAPRELAAHLLRETEAAISRHTLLQAASLPDDAPAASTRLDQASSRVVFEMPLASEQGTGIAQFKIERDASGTGTGHKQAVWRAEFSIDLEPIGPVHARIALSGDRTTVMLFAERDESAASLRDALPVLEASLTDAALQPGELECRQGRAPVAPSPKGMFLNRAS